MEKKWFNLATGLLISGAVFAADGENGKGKKELFPKNFKPGIGMMYNSRFPVNNRCLKEMPLEYSGFHSTLSLTNTTSIENLAKNLNIDLEAKAGWSKFSSSGAAHYVKSAKEDDYSLSFNYQNIIAGHASLVTDQYYGVDALNAAGKAAFEQSTDKFISRCGDSYIHGIDMGAILNITLKLNFHSKFDKQSFEASVDGKIGDAFSASAKIQKAIETTGVTGSIEVMAYQAGGSPNLLSSIFGSDSEHPIVRCSLNSMENCAKTIDEFLSYAQASGNWKENGFAQQVKVKDGKIIAETLEPIGLSDAVIGSFANDFGLDMEQTPASDEVIKARRELNEIYEKYLSNFNKIKNISNSLATKNLHTDMQNQINKAYITQEDNLKLFTPDRILSCFLPTKHENCLNVVEDIKKQSNKIEEKLFNLLNGAYYVNINHVWPAVLIENNQGFLEFYDINLNKQISTSHNLRLIPSYDFSYIAVSGGYSYINPYGKQVRYYMDYYGNEDIVYRKGPVFFRNVPWNTCVAGVCSKVYNDFEIIPF